MMDKTTKSSAASRTVERERTYMGIVMRALVCIEVRCWALEGCVENKFKEQLSG